MENMLFIFDDNININGIWKVKRQNKIDSIDLFPLTSNWLVIDEVKSWIGSNDSQMCLLNSARLINDEVEKIREKVSKWSANLGDYKIWDKSIKEWFLTPKKDVSTWWFSLLSEKNTLKTDVFFALLRFRLLKSCLNPKIMMPVREV